MKRIALGTILLVASTMFVLLPQAVSQAANWQDIAIPPLPAFHPQQPKRIQLRTHGDLPAEDHELPLIQWNGTHSRRLAHEPAKKVGLLDIYSEVWRTGAPSRRPATNWMTFSRSAPPGGNRWWSGFDLDQLHLPKS